MKTFILLVLVSSMFLAGCGTIYNNMPRSVHIVSSPSGANYKIYDRAGKYVNRVNSIASEIEMAGYDNIGYPLSMLQNNLSTPDMIYWSPNRFYNVTFEKSGYTSKTIKMQKTNANFYSLFDILYFGSGFILYLVGDNKVDKLKNEPPNINNISNYADQLFEAKSIRTMGKTLMISGGIMALIDIVTGNYRTYPDYIAAKLIKTSQATSTDEMHGGE